MTLEAREWLPAGALTSAALSSLVHETVGAWAEHWIERPTRLTPSAIDPVVPQASGSKLLGWTLYGNNVGVHMAPAALFRLLALVLNCRLEPAGLTPADRRVLDDLELAMLSDLAKRLDDVFGEKGTSPDRTPKPKSPFETDGGVEFAFSDEAGHHLFSLGLPAPVLASARKSLVSEPAGSGRPLQPFSDALADEFVDVGAVIGRSTISLTDLSQLVAGDVLVLDRGVEEPIEITVNDSEEPLGFASITEDDGQIALSFF